MLEEVFLSVGTFGKLVIRMLVEYRRRGVGVTGRLLLDFDSFDSFKFELFCFFSFEAVLLRC